MTTRANGNREATPTASPNAFVRHLSAETFRASALYELVPYRQLSRSERTELGPLRRVASTGGILRPRTSNALTLKIAGADTMALISALHRTGRLPRQIRDTYSDRTNVEIARLVLDGVLQLRDGRSFVTAAAAHDCVFDATPAPTARGRIARLSLDALHHAQTLDISDALALSARLYFYNRAPVTPYWRQRLASGSAIDALLSIGPSGSTTMLLGGDWHVNRGSTGWIAWSRPAARSAIRHDAITHKLYVSPVCTALREAFPPTVRVLARSSAAMFKVGADLNGLLRPDKLVAYFSSRHDMLTTADSLAHELRDVPAHGVPFTGELTDSAVLSWGIDPPIDAARPAWRENESWRLWVTNRLALYLLLAKETGRPPLEPWRFALDRLRLDGVDTDSWTPSTALGEAT